MKYITVVLSLIFLSNTLKADTFNHNGVTLDYTVSGSGPALFMLHGGMVSRDDLSLQITVLSATHKIIALDSREQGRSSQSTEQISYELMVSDVLALANHLGIQEFSLFGQSDGGITALHIAINHPERVKNLILLGTLYNHSAVSEEAKSYLRNYQWQPNMVDEGFAGIFTKDWLKHHGSMDGFNDQLQEMITIWVSSPNFTGQDLKRITAKTLIINGDHEDVDLTHTLSMYEAIKNAQLFIVPGATHFLHQEKPGLLNNVIGRFLAED